MDQKLIGKFIAALRKEQQMTQDQLAERIGSVLRIRTETREMEFKFSNPDAIDDLLMNLKR